jgi:hypothetical protein
LATALKASARLVVSPIALIRFWGPSRSNDFSREHFTERHFIHRHDTARQDELRPPGAAEDHRSSPSSAKTDPSQFGRFSVKTRPTSPVDLGSFGLDNLNEGGEASLIESEASQKSAGR